MTPEKKEDLKKYNQDIMCEICEKFMGFAPYSRNEYICADCDEEGLNK
jgi:hypothetical protein